MVVFDTAGLSVKFGHNCHTHCESSGAVISESVWLHGVEWAVAHSGFSLVEGSVHNEQEGEGLKCVWWCFFFFVLFCFVYMFLFVFSLQFRRTEMGLTKRNMYRPMFCMQWLSFCLFVYPCFCFIFYYLFVYLFVCSYVSLFLLSLKLVPDFICILVPFLLMPKRCFMVTAKFH